MEGRDLYYGNRSSFFYHTASTSTEVSHWWSKSLRGENQPLICIDNEELSSTNQENHSSKKNKASRLSSCGSQVSKEGTCLACHRPSRKDVCTAEYWRRVRSLSRDNKRRMDARETQWRLAELEETKRRKEILSRRRREREELTERFMRQPLLNVRSSSVEGSEEKASLIAVSRSVPDLEEAFRTIQQKQLARARSQTLTSSSCEAWSAREKRSPLICRKNVHPLAATQPPSSSPVKKNSRGRVVRENQKAYPTRTIEELKARHSFYTSSRHIPTSATARKRVDSKEYTENISIPADASSLPEARVIVVQRPRIIRRRSMPDLTKCKCISSTRVYESVAALDSSLDSNGVIVLQKNLLQPSPQGLLKNSRKQAKMNYLNEVINNGTNETDDLRISIQGGKKTASGSNKAFGKSSHSSLQMSRRKEWTAEQMSKKEMKRKVLSSEGLENTSPKQVRELKTEAKKLAVSSVSSEGNESSFYDSLEEDNISGDSKRKKDSFFVPLEGKDFYTPPTNFTLPPRLSSRIKLLENVLQRPHTASVAVRSLSLKGKKVHPLQVEALLLSEGFVYTEIQDLDIVRLERPSSTESVQTSSIKNGLAKLPGLDKVQNNGNIVGDQILCDSIFRSPKPSDKITLNYNELRKPEICQNDTINADSSTLFCNKRTSNFVTKHFSENKTNIMYSNFSDSPSIKLTTTNSTSKIPIRKIVSSESNKAFVTTKHMDTKTSTNQEDETVNISTLSSLSSDASLSGMVENNETLSLDAVSDCQSLSELTVNKNTYSAVDTKTNIISTLRENGIAFIDDKEHVKHINNSTKLQNRKTDYLLNETNVKAIEGFAGNGREALLESGFGDDESCGSDHDDSTESLGSCDERKGNTQREMIEGKSSQHKEKDAEGQKNITDNEPTNNYNKVSQWFAREEDTLKITIEDEVFLDNKGLSLHREYATDTVERCTIAVKNREQIGIDNEEGLEPVQRENVEPIKDHNLNISKHNAPVKSEENVKENDECEEQSENYSKNLDQNANAQNSDFPNQEIDGNENLLEGGNKTTETVFFEKDDKNVSHPLYHQKNDEIVAFEDQKAGNESYKVSEKEPVLTTNIYSEVTSDPFCSKENKENANIVNQETEKGSQVDGIKEKVETIYGVDTKDASDSLYPNENEKNINVENQEDESQIYEESETNQDETTVLQEGEETSKILLHIETEDGYGAVDQEIWDGQIVESENTVRPTSIEGIGILTKVEHKEDIDETAKSVSYEEPENELLAIIPDEESEGVPANCCEGKIDEDTNKEVENKIHVGSKNQDMNAVLQEEIEDVSETLFRNENEVYVGVGNQEAEEERNVENRYDIESGLVAEESEDLSSTTFQVENKEDNKQHIHAEIHEETKPKLGVAKEENDVSVEKYPEEEKRERNGVEDQETEDEFLMESENNEGEIADIKGENKTISERLPYSENGKNADIQTEKAEYERSIRNKNEMTEYLEAEEKFESILDSQLHIKTLEEVDGILESEIHGKNENELIATVFEKGKENTSQNGEKELNEDVSGTLLQIENEEGADKNNEEESRNETGIELVAAFSEKESEDTHENGERKQWEDVSETPFRIENEGNADRNAEMGSHEETEKDLEMTMLEKGEKYAPENEERESSKNKNISDFSSHSQNEEDADETDKSKSHEKIKNELVATVLEEGIQNIQEDEERKPAKKDSEILLQIENEEDASGNVEMESHEETEKDLEMFLLEGEEYASENKEREPSDDVSGTTLKIENEEGADENDESKSYEEIENELIVGVLEEGSEATQKNEEKEPSEVVSETLHQIENEEEMKSHEGNEKDLEVTLPEREGEYTQENEEREPRVVVSETLHQIENEEGTEGHDESKSYEEIENELIVAVLEEGSEDTQKNEQEPSEVVSETLHQIENGEDANENVEMESHEAEKDLEVTLPEKEEEYASENGEREPSVVVSETLHQIENEEGTEGHDESKSYEEIENEFIVAVLEEGSEDTQKNEQEPSEVVSETLHQIENEEDANENVEMESHEAENDLEVTLHEKEEEYASENGEREPSEDVSGTTLQTENEEDADGNDKSKSYEEIENDLVATLPEENENTQEPEEREPTEDVLETPLQIEFEEDANGIVEMQSQEESEDELVAIVLEQEIKDAQKNEELEPCKDVSGIAVQDKNEENTDRNVGRDNHEETENELVAIVFEEESEHTQENLERETYEDVLESPFQIKIEKNTDGALGDKLHEKLENKIVTTVLEGRNKDSQETEERETSEDVSETTLQIENEGDGNGNVEMESHEETVKDLEDILPEGRGGGGYILEDVERELSKDVSGTLLQTKNDEGANRIFGSEIHKEIGAELVVTVHEGENKETRENEERIPGEAISETFLQIENEDTDGNISDIVHQVENEKDADGNVLMENYDENERDFEVTAGPEEGRKYIPGNEEQEERKNVSDIAPQIENEEDADENVKNYEETETELVISVSDEVSNDTLGKGELESNEEVANSLHQTTEDEENANEALESESNEDTEKDLAVTVQEYTSENEERVQSENISDTPPLIEDANEVSENDSYGKTEIIFVMTIPEEAAKDAQSGERGQTQDDAYCDPSLEAETKENYVNNMEIEPNEAVERDKNNITSEKNTRFGAQQNSEFGTISASGDNEEYLGLGDKIHENIYAKSQSLLEIEGATETENIEEQGEKEELEDTRVKNGKEVSEEIGEREEEYDELHVDDEGKENETNETEEKEIKEDFQSLTPDGMDGIISTSFNLGEDGSESSISSDRITVVRNLVSSSRNSCSANSTCAVSDIEIDHTSDICSNVEETQFLDSAEEQTSNLIEGSENENENGEIESGNNKGENASNNEHQLHVSILEKLNRGCYIGISFEEYKNISEDILMDHLLDDTTKTLIKKQISDDGPKEIYSENDIHGFNNTYDIIMDDEELAKLTCDEIRSTDLLTEFFSVVTREENHSPSQNIDSNSDLSTIEEENEQSSETIEEHKSDVVSQVEGNNTQADSDHILSEESSESRNLGASLTQNEFEKMHSQTLDEGLLQSLIYEESNKMVNQAEEDAGDFKEQTEIQHKIFKRNTDSSDYKNASENESEHVENESQIIENEKKIVESFNDKEAGEEIDHSQSFSEDITLSSEDRTKDETLHTPDNSIEIEYEEDLSIESASKKSIIETVVEDFYSESILDVSETEDFIEIDSTEDKRQESGSKSLLSENSLEADNIIVESEAMDNILVSKSIPSQKDGTTSQLNLVQLNFSDDEKKNKVTGDNIVTSSIMDKKPKKINISNINNKYLPYSTRPKLNERRSSNLEVGGKKNEYKTDFTERGNSLSGSFSDVQDRKQGEDLFETDVTFTDETSSREARRNYYEKSRNCGLQMIVDSHHNRRNASFDQGDPILSSKSPSSDSGVMELAGPSKQSTNSHPAMIREIKDDPTSSDQLSESQTFHTVLERRDKTLLNRKFLEPFQDDDLENTSISENTRSEANLFGELPNTPLCTDSETSSRRRKSFVHEYVETLNMEGSSAVDRDCRLEGKSYSSKSHQRAKAPVSSDDESEPSSDYTLRLLRAFERRRRRRHRHRPPNIDIDDFSNKDYRPSLLSNFDAFLASLSQNYQSDHLQTDLGEESPASGRKEVTVEVSSGKELHDIRVKAENKIRLLVEVTPSRSKKKFRVAPTTDSKMPTSSEVFQNERRKNQMIRSESSSEELWHVPRFNNYVGNQPGFGGMSYLRRSANLNSMNDDCDLSVEGNNIEKCFTGHSTRAYRHLLNVQNRVAPVMTGKKQSEGDPNNKEQRRVQRSIKAIKELLKTLT